MDKKDILKFEVDDTSEMGINGKQVFVAKRINGKTTHNKIKKEPVLKESKTEKNKINEDELFIEFQTQARQERKEKPQEKNTPKKKKVVKKKKSKKSRKRKIAKAIVLLTIIAGITILAMMSPLFSIKDIDVQGNEKISSETIISLSGIKKQNNIFRISKNDATKKIKEESYIDNVSIRRKLPGIIEIKVSERKVAYQVQVIDSYVYIDYQGYILETASTKQNVPTIEGFFTEQNTLLKGKRLKSDDFGALNKILKIMESSKNLGISELISKIKIEGNELILEIESENKTVYLGNGEEINTKLGYLKQILSDLKGKEGKIFLNGELNNGFKPYFRDNASEENQEENNSKKEGEQNE